MSTDLPFTSQGSQPTPSRMSVLKAVLGFVQERREMAYRTLTKDFLWLHCKRPLTMCFLSIMHVNMHTSKSPFCWFSTKQIRWHHKAETCQLQKKSLLIVKGLKGTYPVAIISERSSRLMLDCCTYQALEYSSLISSNLIGQFDSYLSGGM